MKSKKTFVQHISLNLYTPKHLIYLYLSENKKHNVDYNDLFHFIYQKFLNQCLLLKTNYLCKPEKIEFHEKYGWILNNKNVYVFLGKMDISSSYIKLEIGRNSYFSGPSLIYGSGRLKIGSFCCIAENFHSFLGEDDHSLDKLGFIDFISNKRLQYEGLYIQKNKKKPDGEITIGNDVWIGRNVTLKNNVSIADRILIGENSLVRKNSKLSTCKLYAGFPAVFKKNIKGIKRKYKQWWDWPKEKILRNKSLFLSSQKPD